MVDPVHTTAPKEEPSSKAVTPYSADRLKFVAEDRKCQHNTETRKQRLSRPMILDYVVMHDGEHIATWSRRGRQYDLLDREYQPVTRRDGSRFAVIAERKDDFNAVTAQYLHRIPTKEHLAAEARKAEADRAIQERDAKIRNAAPMLAATLTRAFLALGRAGGNTLKSPYRKEWEEARELLIQVGVIGSAS